MNKMMRNFRCDYVEDALLVTLVIIIVVTLYLAAVYLLILSSLSTLQQLLSGTHGSGIRDIKASETSLRLNARSASDQSSLIRV